MLMKTSTVATHPGGPAFGTRRGTATDKDSSYLHQLQAQADRLMLGVMLLLALASLALAITRHAWMPFWVLALPTLAVTALQVRIQPGSLASRMTVGLGFMAMSAATIQQAHGMVEFHFGIILLLALLLYYRIGGRSSHRRAPSPCTTWLCGTCRRVAPAYGSSPPGAGSASCCCMRLTWWLKPPSCG